MPLAEADPPPGRRWNPWDIAISRVVDTARNGPLTYGMAILMAQGSTPQRAGLPAKAGEPAYPVYNTGAGEGWSPSIPPKSALTRISRPGAPAPAFPVPTHPHG